MYPKKDLRNIHMDYWILQQKYVEHTDQNVIYAVLKVLVYGEDNNRNLIIMAS